MAEEKPTKREKEKSFSWNKNIRISKKLNLEKFISILEQQRPIQN